MIARLIQIVPDILFLAAMVRIVLDVPETISPCKDHIPLTYRNTNEKHNFYAPDVPAAEFPCKDASQAHKSKNMQWIRTSTTLNTFLENKTKHAMNKSGPDLDRGAP